MKLLKLTRTLQADGFTLIEIMVTVAILAIVAAVGFPAYQQQALKSKRADGIALLIDVAQRQERFIIDNDVYTTAITAAQTATPPGLGLTSEFSEKGYYKVSAVLGNNDLFYTLTATAQGTQAGSSGDECGNLTLKSTGERGWSVSTATKCW